MWDVTDLQTSLEFAKENQANYSLKIRAFDHGTPPLFAGAWVKVKVIETKFPPAVTPPEVEFLSFRFSLDKRPKQP